jgi:hypothetical protein
MSYDMQGRNPPLKASVASLMAHWPLDEGQGEYLYDRGPAQVVYPILGKHVGQNFRWKNINQISPYMSHLFICLDSSQVYDPLQDRCDPFNVPTMSFNPSNDPVKLSQGLIPPLVKDWTVEVWLKFTQTSQNPFSILE